AAAIVTIVMKFSGYLVTGSVGLLSDAAESLVNLVAAVVAVVVLKVIAKPADRDHEFGHSKAEYFSAGLEGAMILVASGFIIAASIGRDRQSTRLNSSHVSTSYAVFCMK